MVRIWILRGVCLVLAAVSLGGCVVEPLHPYGWRRPVYYYR